MGILIKQITPIIDYKVKGLCVKPYDGHKHGCPNFGSGRFSCPPNAPRFEDFFDITQSMYAIVCQYDFQSHVNKLKTAHPDWSEKKLNCCLYWQGSARKELNQAVNQFLQQNPNYVVTICPEGMGLLVTDTVKQIGVQVEWFPKIYAHKIAIAGIPKNQMYLTGTRIY